MGFREINDKPFGDVEKTPFFISCVYKWEFYDNTMYNRFIKLQSDNEVSFCSEYDWEKFCRQIKSKERFDEEGNEFNDESIKLYIKSYTEGFLKGYDDLDNEIRDKTSIFKVTNNEIADFIFSILHVKGYPFSGDYKWLDDELRSKKILTHNFLLDSGFEVGRIYKAWFYIIAHHKLFHSLFKNFYISFYRNVEKELKDRNSHHIGYKTELQDIIDEYDNQIQEPNIHPHSINEAHSSNLELDKFIVNVSNAGTLSRQELKSILSEVKEGTIRIYKPLSVRCGVTGLDDMICGMLDAALAIFVFFDKKQNVEVPIWKLQYINSLENSYEITNDWFRQIYGQSSFILINFGAAEARNFVKIVESVFMQINDICRAYSGHNFNINNQKILFDKCLEDLEIEYNTESVKLRNKKSKAIDGKLEHSNNKYCISICFSNETPKSRYDVRIIKSNISLEDEFKTEDRLMTELFYRLIGFIFTNKELTFETKKCLDYHCSNSNLSKRKFKKYLTRIFISELATIQAQGNTLKNERVSVMKKWLGIFDVSTKSKLIPVEPLPKLLADVKRLPAKFYAFLHHLKIKLNLEPQFGMYDADRFDKRQIENFACENYGFENGQSFYREFISIDLNNKKELILKFGAGYKVKIIRLSGNNNKIIEELKDFPN
ncbi:MAG: hypothetical protein EOO44_06275 [Flavobacterium sp.]|nr:MAG: hypothetical protein EOO44_06275 [Flavobacterium sp.]